MAENTLDSLVTLSARIGRNPALVQAGGGNTSIKKDGTLWIKASGMWLANALTEDMFVPVPMSDIDRNLGTGDEKFSDYATRSGKRLRPSVETTMHAVLPQRVVIHVHSVAAISWAAQQDPQEELAFRLNGLRWSWIPYIHPGVPLALRIRQDAPKRPEVLLLGNHGLVVAEDDLHAAEELLNEVERRLDRKPRPASHPDFERLRTVAVGTDWRPAPHPDVHSVATDRVSSRIAAAGTMYPDHCVYLGPAAPLLRPGETINEALNRYTSRHHYDPAFLLVEGAGVLASDHLGRAGFQMLGCLNSVVLRIPETSELSYLADDQVARLLNWDAEKYRISVARMQEEASQGNLANRS